MPPLSRPRRTSLSLLALAALMLAPHAGAQATRERARGDSASRPPREPARLYDERAPLTLTFTANMGQLRRDKADGAPWRPATLSYEARPGEMVTVPARARTRGKWRLANCRFPPVRLDFARGTSRNTVFAGLNRPKLVSYCQDDDRGEQYILQEFQLYRIYELLSPIAHRARLLRMTYADSGSNKVLTTRYAFLLEEPQAVAARTGTKFLELQGARSEDLDPFGNALLGVFQYFIGNTDWSTSALHNVELYATAATIFPIPFDFDYSGAVDARYAVPPPQLPIKRVRDRLMRGYCAPTEEYEKVFALFKEKRAAITALYSDELGRLLDATARDRTLEYFDEFYRVIGEPRLAEREIVRACIKR
jgi:hypothetical protein